MEFVFEHWHDEDGFWYIRLRTKDGKISTYRFETEDKWTLTCNELRKVEQ